MEGKFLQTHANVYRLLADDLERMVFGADRRTVKVDRGLVILLMEAVIREVLMRLPFGSQSEVFSAALKARTGDGHRMRELIRCLRTTADSLDGWDST